MKLSSLLECCKRCQTQGFQLSVLAALAIVGFWGHRIHWDFSAKHAGPAVTISHAADRGQYPVLPPQVAVGPSNESSSSGKLDGQETQRIHLATAKTCQQLDIKTTAATRQRITSEVIAAGVVTYEPNCVAQLSSRVPGTVWRLEKQVGQAIQAGDILAIIDAPAVGQAKAEFLHSIADVALRDRVWKRLQLLERGELPIKQVEEAETALRKARVDLFNAQQALISLGFSINLDEWIAMSESDLQHRLKFLGLPEQVVSQLNPNATTASLLPIYAPFSGIVIGRELTLGEAVSPTESHFEIADVSKMWIVLNVREQDADKLELGQKVTFKTDSATVSSTLSWMSTALDEKTRTVKARCETANPELNNSAGEPSGKRLLRANVFGVATIQIYDRPAALAVPTKAVQRNGDLQIVFVQIEPQTFEARTVRVGIVTRETTEVLEGLLDREAVVADGSHILKAELAGAKLP